MIEKPKSPFLTNPSVAQTGNSIKKESSSRRPRKREKLWMTPWHCARHARYRLLGPTTTCHRLVSLKTTSTPRNKGIVKGKRRGTREYKKKKRRKKTRRVAKETGNLKMYIPRRIPGRLIESSLSAACCPSIRQIARISAAGSFLIPWNLAFSPAVPTY